MRNIFRFGIVLGLGWLTLSAATPSANAQALLGGPRLNSGFGGAGIYGNGFGLAGNYGGAGYYNNGYGLNYGTPPPLTYNNLNGVASIVGQTALRRQGSGLPSTRRRRR